MKNKFFRRNKISYCIICSFPFLFLQMAGATDTHISGEVTTPVTVNDGDTLYVDSGAYVHTTGTEINTEGNTSLYIDGTVGNSSGSLTDYDSSITTTGDTYINIGDSGVVLSNESRGTAITTSGETVIDNAGDIGLIDFENNKTVSYGIVSHGDVTINNTSSGIISGSSGAIVNVDGNIGVNNDGGIYSSINGSGVEILQSTTSASINNSSSGVISGAYAGVLMDASHGHMLVTNEGEIVATRGDMIGGGYGIYVEQGSADIVNNGVIIGAENPDGSGELSSIYLSTSGNTVTLGTGSQVYGSIKSVNTNNTISLNGTGAEDDDILGFDSLTMNGDNWVLSGDIQITGNSDSALHVENGQLTISGTVENSGGTLIDSGSTLIAANINALGDGNVDNSGQLVLDAGAFNLTQQNITTHSGGSLDIASGSTLQVDTLNQEQGSELDVYLNMPVSTPIITAEQVNLDGTLNIAGISGVPEAKSVTIIDAEQPINGNFDNLTIAGMSSDQVDFIDVDGGIDAADNTKYDLSFGLSWYAGSYTSAKPASGTFTLLNPDYSFTVDVALNDTDPGAGSDWDGRSLTKDGAGTLILSADNTYSGTTDVKEGALWLTDTGVIGAEGSQQFVNVDSDAAFGGSGTVNGNVNNQGELSFGDGTAPSTLTINGSVTNSGSIASGGSTPGNTLAINGDYTGDNGSLTLNTALGDDTSATDKLVVTGNTSGNTTLYINNVGGTGALTDKGIEVVDVGGESDGTFTQGNQVEIGLYEYRLYEDNGDWYLRSEETGGGTQYRADIGAYLGNQWMARSLQMQTLYDREGSQYRSADGNVWARFKAGDAQSQAAHGNIDMTNNYSQFQLGSDILTWNYGEHSLVAGVMGSYINADTHSDGNRGADGSQFSAKGNVDGYNMGLYATWFADAKSHSGMYIDSWYQYGIYDNTVDNGDSGSTSYDSTANAISLEAGWRQDVILSQGKTLSLTPQAQIVWQQYNADGVKDSNGTHIDGQDSHSWTTRLGLRADSKLQKGNGVIQPFIEANWLHTSDDTAVSFDDAEVKQDLPANRGELKAGIQVNVNQQWSVTGQVAGQKGGNDYSDLNGSLNLSYRW